MGIFYVIDGLTFSFPVCFLKFNGHRGAGVYAIIAYNENFGPYPYEIIYYGENSDLGKPDFLTSRHKYHSWTKQADPQDLYIAVYEMPKSSKQQRKAVKTDLLRRYKPVCNN